MCFCVFHKVVLSVLYNIPSWFSPIPMVLYSHKRWYPQGYKLPGSRRSIIVEGNIFTNHLYQRRNNRFSYPVVKCEEQTRLYLYRRRFRQRTFLAENMRRQLNEYSGKFLKKDHQYIQNIMFHAGNTKPLDDYFSAVWATPRRPFPPVLYRHIRASRWKGNEWLIFICFRNGCATDMVIVNL